MVIGRENEQSRSFWSFDSNWIPVLQLEVILQRYWRSIVHWTWGVTSFPNELSIDGTVRINKLLTQQPSVCYTDQVIQIFWTLNNRNLAVSGQNGAEGGCMFAVRPWIGAAAWESIYYYTCRLIGLRFCRQSDSRGASSTSIGCEKKIQPVYTHLWRQATLWPVKRVRLY